MPRKPKPPRKSQPPRKWPDWYYEDLERDPELLDEEDDQEFDAEFDRELDKEDDRELDDEADREFDDASKKQKEFAAEIARAWIAKIVSQREQRAAESPSAESGTPGPATPEQASPELMSAAAAPADIDQSVPPALEHADRRGPDYIRWPSGIAVFHAPNAEPDDDAPPASAAGIEAQSASNAAAPFAPSERRTMNAVTPYWLPDGAEFDAWPADLKRSVVDVINPSYDELVIRAQPGLAKIAGLSIVQLMWLEIIEHIKLARLGHGCELPDPNDPLGLVRSADQLTRSQGEPRERILERSLRLANVKLKACNFLARLREFKAQWPRVDTWTDAHGIKNVGYIDGPAAPAPPR